MNPTVKIMTPGPTQVRENVRMARSFVTTNPDLDLTFYDEYKELCDHLSSLLHTDNASYILSGEGIFLIIVATQVNDAKRAVITIFLVFSFILGKLLYFL